MSKEVESPIAPEVKKNKPIENREPAGGIPQFYANSVALGASKFDVRVIFGEMHDVTEDKIIVNQRVQVTMSWHEAKILGEFLVANVKAFEELNGPLRLPKIVEKVVIPNTFGDQQGISEPPKTVN